MSRVARARTRLDVEERRAQLLALGVEFFSARPYDAVAIDDIARAAGISKGLLYHYFPTKRAFYVAATREGARQLLEQTTRATAPPLERLRVGLDAYLDYVTQHADAYVALLRSGVGADPEVARIVEDTRWEFVRRLREGIDGAALAVRAPGPLLRVALRGWVGFVEATSLDWIEHRDVDREALCALWTTVLLAAINPETAGGAP